MHYKEQSAYRCPYASSRKDQQKAKRVQEKIKPFNLIKEEFRKRYSAVSAKAEQVVKGMENYDRLVREFGHLRPTISKIKKQQIGEAIKAGKDFKQLFAYITFSCKYFTC